MTTLRTDSTHSGITIDYANGSYRPAYKSVAQWQQDKDAGDKIEKYFYTIEDMLNYKWIIEVSN